MQSEDLNIQGASAPRIERSMAGVIKQFRPTYATRVGHRVSYDQRKAMNAIERCRTAALGGHVLECTNCRRQDYAYHSCRHRACPRCMRQDTETWLQERRNELLPVPYFHIVFSVPPKLHSLVRAHKRQMYPLLAAAAAKAIQKVAANPKYLGAATGVMAILHTAARSLAYHPHVHCLVPAGGLDDQRQWRHATKPGFAPKKLLANTFRDTLLAMMTPVAKALRLQLPAKCRNGWKVFAEVPAHGVEKVLEYLANSALRGPLHNHRIIDVTPHHVTFDYHDPKLQARRLITLEGHEFLRRFLQHVWPQGLHQVRYFGLWSRKSAPLLQALRQQLQNTTTTPPPPQGVAPPLTEPPPATEPHWLTCPQCKASRVVVAHFAPGTTPPPLRNPLPIATSPPQQALAPP